MNAMWCSCWAQVSHVVQVRAAVRKAEAYNIVEKIFYFRNQRKKCTFDTVYNAKEIEDNDKSILLHANP